MSESKNNSIGISGLLGIAFVVLKLTGVIDWSWWWVLLPFYGATALLLLILLSAWITALFYRSGSKFREDMPADPEPKEPKKSKFQERLEEAMEAQRSKSRMN